MAVTLNSRGTTVPYFTIGKAGTTIYQGDADPVAVHVVKPGDFWLDTNTKAIRVMAVDGTSWAVPKLGDMSVEGGSFTSPGDITLNSGALGSVVVNTAGTGPTVITTDNINGISIDPGVNGGQSLIIKGSHWPTSTPVAGQVMMMGESSQMVWSALPPSPVTTKTVDYTAVVTDSVILANGTITITLPNATTVPSGKTFTVKRIGTTGAVSVVVAGNGLIDGNSLINISTQYSSLTLVSDGVSYWAI